MRNSKLMAMVAILTLICIDQASAQQPRNRFGESQRRRPTVSPMINMVDNGNGNADQSGLNYFGQVRPIQRARAANQRLQNELENVESDIGRAPSRPIPMGNGLDSYAITTGRMPPTGHATAFGDTGGRFQSSSAAGRANNFGSNVAQNGFGRGGIFTGGVGGGSGGFGSGVAENRFGRRW